MKARANDKKDLFSPTTLGNVNSGSGGTVMNSNNNQKRLGKLEQMKKRNLNAPFPVVCFEFSNKPL